MHFTLQELRSRIAYKIDPYMKTFTPALIDDAINEAQDFIASETLCSVRVFDMINLTEGEKFYNLRDVDATGKDLIIRVLVVLFYNGTDYTNLRIYTQKELDISNAGWRSADNSTPTKAAVDGNWLTIYPAPDADYANGIRIISLAYLDDLVNDGDECKLPARLQRYVPIYVFNSLSNRDIENEQLKGILKRERSSESIFKAVRKFAQNIDISAAFEYR